VKEHLVRNDLIRHCYCGKEFDDKDWDTEFASHMHYKTLKCSCGRKNLIKVNCDGSHHDQWAEKRTKGGFDQIVQDEHKKIMK
jgi:hypothetical protein